MVGGHSVVEVMARGAYMLTETEQFQQWLHRRSPYASSHIHYANDTKLFFTWLGKPIANIAPADIDAFIEHCQSQRHALTGGWRRCVPFTAFSL